LLPLAVYYATTIGVPLANGVFRHGPVAADFWLHSLFVLLTPLFLLLTLAILSFLRERRPKLEVETIEYMQAADI
jgi:hypothetical protein